MEGVPMHQPRLRQLMITVGVALLALALAVLVFFLYLWWRLHAVYGPGGELDRERRKSSALPARTTHQPDFVHIAITARP
jgi:hypothetical protein